MFAIGSDIRDEVPRQPETNEQEQDEPNQQAAQASQWKAAFKPASCYQVSPVSLRIELSSSRADRESKRSFGPGQTS